MYNKNKMFGGLHYDERGADYELVVERHAVEMFSLCLSGDTQGWKFSLGKLISVHHCRPVHLQNINTDKTSFHLHTNTCCIMGHNIVCRAARSEHDYSLTVETVNKYK